MRDRSTILCLLLLALSARSDAVAQQPGQSPFDQDFLRTFPKKPEKATPQLSFLLLNEIELPGPLPGAGPVLADDRIAIPVSGNLAAHTSWAAGASPELTPWSPQASQARSPAEAAWVEDASGRRRYRTLPEGRLVAEKRCGRCRRGWRKLWKLRMPGSTVAPPLVTEDRIFVGAMDNRIYALRRRNGHRLWSADAQSRLSRRLVLYTIDPASRESSTDDSPEPEALDLVLAVPDDRPEIQAWSAKTGRRVATFELGKDEGRLVGVPLPTPDAKLVVARQGYQASQASLMVLQMSAPHAAGGEGSPEATDPAGGAE